METKFIVMTTGEMDISELKKNIPELVIVRDTTKNAMDTFTKSLLASEGYPSVHMEDDIILCPEFYSRITQIIKAYPDTVIQFFSMRKEDLTIGTRFIEGSKFMMNQCFYLPAGMALKIVDYKSFWHRIKEHPTGYDLLMADFFHERKIKYLNIVPNLVDHKVCKSRINPKRSSKRQSLTFNKWNLIK